MIKVREIHDLIGHRRHEQSIETLGFPHVTRLWEHCRLLSFLGYMTASVDAGNMEASVELIGDLLAKGKRFVVATNVVDKDDEEIKDFDICHDEEHVISIITMEPINPGHEDYHKPVDREIKL